MIFYEGHKVYMNGEYPAIFLDGKSQHVHRLEWMKHCGELPRGAIIHHIDGNKLNWHISNLQMLSRSEHLKQHNDIVKRPGVPVVAIKGDLVLQFDSIKDAAEYCGTHSAQIRNCFIGKQKQSKGWVFRRGLIWECL